LSFLLVVGIICCRPYIDAKQRFAIEATPDFSPTQKFTVSSGAVAVDDVRQKIAFVKGELNPTVKIISFADVLESQIDEDGQSVTKTSTSSLAGRALVAGLC